MMILFAACAKPGFCGLKMDTPQFKTVQLHLYTYPVLKVIIFHPYYHCYVVYYSVTSEKSLGPLQVDFCHLSGDCLTCPLTNSTTR